MKYLWNNIWKHKRVKCNKKKKNMNYNTFPLKDFYFPHGTAQWKQGYYYRFSILVSVNILIFNLKFKSKCNFTITFYKQTFSIENTNFNAFNWDELTTWNISKGTWRKLYYHTFPQREWCDNHKPQVRIDQKVEKDNREILTNGSTYSRRS